MPENNSGGAYWKANLRLVAILLVIWAFVSYGMGILFRPALEGIRVGGTDIGFWFAQQGSMIVFLIIVFVYAHLMNKLDREHGVHED
ncbi:DUF4212 domain-containing protein [Magnetospira sp. QH-2]|uniref:DUF4212 domain-containing protein n=1 Tax=Magnetospira sp. (strain QH-2) TaxID=1288970 RepID=UPI0005FA82EB|nr:DUF4212 domain-containing protein [Magnetospira sp. QH-2]